VSKVPDWLYKPANVSQDETKLIQIEVIKFLKSWCQTKNVNFSSLTTQFIQLNWRDQDRLFHNISQLPTVDKILTRMQIKHLLITVGFIIVNENKYFPIHIDYYNTEFINFGLNIPILNCKGSQTVWYDSIPDDNDDMPDYIGNLTKVSTSVSVKCVQDNVKEIGSCDANMPHWINVAVPHAPRCEHSKLRINASFRFNTLEDDFIHSTRFEQLMVKQSSH
jgi:hypothetical protein